MPKEETITEKTVEERLDQLEAESNNSNTKLAELTFELDGEKDKTQTLETEYKEQLNRLRKRQEKQILEIKNSLIFQLRKIRREA